MFRMVRPRQLGGGRHGARAGPDARRVRGTVALGLRRVQSSVARTCTGGSVWTVPEIVFDRSRRLASLCATELRRRDCADAGLIDDALDGCMELASELVCPPRAAPGRECERKHLREVMCTTCTSEQGVDVALAAELPTLEHVPFFGLIQLYVLSTARLKPARVEI